MGAAMVYVGSTGSFRNFTHRLRGRNQMYYVKKALFLVSEYFFATKITCFSPPKILHTGRHTLVANEKVLICP